MNIARLKSHQLHDLSMISCLPVGRQGVSPTPPEAFEAPTEIQDPAPAPEIFPASMVWMKCACGLDDPVGALRASDFLLEFDMLV